MIANQNLYHNNSMNCTEAPLPMIVSNETVELRVADKNYKKK